MIKIIRADLKIEIHQSAIFNLLNVYIKDKMGGGIPFPQSSKKKLIRGLSGIPNALIYLAVENKSFIGMIVCYTGFSTFMLKKFLNIHDIIVMPEHRGKGIGRQLMEHAEKKAKKSNFGKITLEVRRDNKNAMHLYKSLKFNECSPPMNFWVKLL